MAGNGVGGNAGEQETRKESEQLSARYFSSRVTAEGEGEGEGGRGGREREGMRIARMHASTWDPRAT